MGKISSHKRFRIPFIDLLRAHRTTAAELARAVERVVRRQWFLFGPELDQFEKEFAAYVRARNCVGVASGFDALKLALMALGLSGEDEVILPANATASTFFAIVAAGARPVLCDVDRETHNMTLDTLRSAVTTRTRIVVPVHMYGNPAPVNQILSWARERGLGVVEDACQAHGATLEGRPVGGIGELAAFSFSPGKNLGAYGDGGAILCRTRTQDARLRRLREYGFKEKNRAVAYGENSCLGEIRCAVLRAKLRHLDPWNLIRGRNAGWYRDLLAEPIRCLRVLPRARSCWHAFVIAVHNRDAVFEELRARGIEAMIHYPWPLHRQPGCRRFLDATPRLPVAERLCREVLSLPVDIHMDRERVEEVAARVNRIAE